MTDSGKSTRREFLVSAGRWTALAIGTAVTLKLVTQKGETCTNQGVCSGCGRFETCGLPQAVAAKATKKPT